MCTFSFNSSLVVMPNDELLESVTSTMWHYTSAGIITYYHSCVYLLLLLTFKDISDGRAPCSLGGGTVHLHLFHMDMHIMRVDALFRNKITFWD